MKHSRCPNLIPHLMKHEKYVIHYRNLKYIQQLGVKITEVHRVIEFEQKAFLKTIHKQEHRIQDLSLIHI